MPSATPPAPTSSSRSTASSRRARPATPTAATACRAGNEICDTNSALTSGVQHLPEGLHHQLLRRRQAPDRQRELRRSPPRSPTARPRAAAASTASLLLTAATVRSRPSPARSATTASTAAPTAAAPPTARASAATAVTAVKNGTEFCDCRDEGRLPARRQRLQLRLQASTLLRRRRAQRSRDLRAAATRPSATRSARSRPTAATASSAQRRVRLRHLQRRPPASVDYGGCDTSCKLGPHCGDMMSQTQAGEECDDGAEQLLRLEPGLRLLHRRMLARTALR